MNGRSRETTLLRKENAMKAFEKNQEQLNVWKTYANMAAMA